jgi:hypothetical protein
MCTILGRMEMEAKERTKQLEQQALSLGIPHRALIQAYDHAENKVAQKEEWKPSSDYVWEAVAASFGVSLAAISGFQMGLPFEGSVTVTAAAFGVMYFLYRRSRYMRWEKEVNEELHDILLGLINDKQCADTA